MEGYLIAPGYSHLGHSCTTMRSHPNLHRMGEERYMLGAMGYYKINLLSTCAREYCEELNSYTDQGRRCIQMCGIAIWSKRTHSHHTSHYMICSVRGCRCLKDLLKTPSNGCSKVWCLGAWERSGAHQHQGNEVWPNQFRKRASLPMK